jgi:hypothetical protein
VLSSVRLLRSHAKRGPRQRRTCWAALSV